MKGIIIYYSLTGFTERYAKWLGEALGFDTVPYAKRAKANLASYDMVLFGSSFHAGMIRKFKWFKQQLPTLTDKRLAVFVTGGMPANSEDIEKGLRQNFTDSEWQQVRAFYLPGGLNYEKMGPVDRVLMAGFRSMVRKKEGENGEIYQHIKASYDLTDQSAILPIVQWSQEK